MAFRRRQRYHKIESFDYKDIDTLRKFINERGKIVSRRVTGLTAKQQRMVTRAVKARTSYGTVAVYTIEVGFSHLQLAPLQKIVQVFNYGSNSKEKR